MITNNSASQSGGGFYVITSTIKIFRSFVNIDSNTARIEGGGIYVTASTIKIFRSLVKIDSNTARVDGGGICALASTIKISRSLVNIESNTAIVNGGGMYLTQGSKLYLLETEPKINVEIFLKVCSNTAQYGGGIFVNDWNPYILDSWTSRKAVCEGKTPSGGTYDCFLQTRYLNKLITPNHGTLVNTLISNNTAIWSGAAIFGGLLDRCSVSSSQFSNGLDYIHKTVAFAANTNFTNRGPLCDQKYPMESEVETQTNNSDCFVNNELYSLVSSEPVQVVLCDEDNNTRGPIEAYALDQVGNPVAGYIKILIHYNSTKYYTWQRVGNQCTELEYKHITSVIPQDSFAQLELYASGPCEYFENSKKLINVSLSDQLTHVCPSNRNGVMCDECEQGLSLVLGSSNCKKCSDTYLLLLIPFALAGIALVVFILFFNITVATGTIYGLIFYANVIAASNNSFIISLPTNFLTVFISWVNLDLGIETCFYSQMTSQTKALLQLVFPAYLFLLTFLIIILTRYINLFSKLLSIRNSVATLATLIVLSYSKLIRFIITTLKLSVNSQKKIHNPSDFFTPDVSYQFTPRHILQLVAAAIILTVGGLFALQLFFSQWFPRCSNWKLMKWTRNTKYTGFMDAYHAPFTPKHRYWVGLLLFALIVHNIVVAMATHTFTAVSYLPILSAAVLSLGRIVFIFLNIRVYKIWYVESLEALFTINVIMFVVFFAIGKGFKQSDNYIQNTLANASMAISFFLFMIMFLYHFYKYILAKTSIEQKLKTYVDSLKKCKTGLRLRQACREEHDLLDLHYNIEDTEEEVDHTLHNIVPYTGGGEEETNTNQYHTSPNIVPATRPDQLREPDLDDLAPITTDDYQSAPPPPRPRANNRQGVTYTVINLIAAHEETGLKR